jgi:cellulose synthase operon protein C
MRLMFSPRSLVLTALIHAALAATALAQEAVAPAVTPADQIIVPVVQSSEPKGVTPAVDPSAVMTKEGAAGINQTGVNQTNAVDTGKGQTPAPSLILPTRGPDLEALRYYAKNGEHDRYRREYQRIESLYPGWIAPRDLFADNSAAEQELWDLFGKNEIPTIKRRIDEMRAADPGWQPSTALLTSIAQHETRVEVKALVNAKNWAGVLAKIDAQPGLINGQDVELLWFAGQAFSETGNKAAAIDAYRAALTVSENASLKAATLQKAAVYLSAEDLEAYINEMMAYVTAAADISVIEDGLIRGLLEASLRTGKQLPERFDGRLRMFMERAVANNNQVDIGLLAWSAFQVEDWEQSHRWFDMMPDENQQPEILEGKVLSLKHKGEWLTAFRKAQEWRDISPDLGRLYINLGAPYLLPQKPENFGAEFLAEFAAKTAELKATQGAETLGWYAYNIRQLKTAHEWFLQSIEWDETDTAVYGLLLTVRAAHDLELFNQYKRIYGPVYPLIAETEFLPCGNDSPIETIYYETEAYKHWRERLQDRFKEEGRIEDQDCLNSIEDRRVNEQRLVERLEGNDSSVAPWDVERTEDAQSKTRIDRNATASFDSEENSGKTRKLKSSKPRRQVVQEEADPVASLPLGTKAVSKPQTSSSGGGSGELARMQSKKDFIGCLTLSARLISAGKATAKDYEARGWCLMGANRPTEAEQAFEKSRKMGGGSAAGYGQSLASLRNGKTNDAMNAAMNTNMSAEKRRELDIEMLTQRARAAFAAKDYQSTLYALDERKKRTSEPRDIMMMRAWSLYHIGFKSEANALMIAIDRQLSTADSRRGVSATGRLN